MTSNCNRRRTYSTSSSVFPGGGSCVYITEDETSSEYGLPITIHKLVNGKITATNEISKSQWYVQSKIRLSSIKYTDGSKELILLSNPSFSIDPDTLEVIDNGNVGPCSALDSHESLQYGISYAREYGEDISNGYINNSTGGSNWVSAGIRYRNCMYNDRYSICNYMYYIDMMNRDNMTGRMKSFNVDSSKFSIDIIKSFSLCSDFILVSMIDRTSNNNHKVGISTPNISSDAVYNVNVIESISNRDILGNGSSYNAMYVNDDKYIYFINRSIPYFDYRYDRIIVKLKRSDLSIAGYINLEGYVNPGNTLTSAALDGNILYVTINNSGMNYYSSDRVIVADVNNLSVINKIDFDKSMGNIHIPIWNLNLPE